MEQDLKELDRQIEEELREIGEMTREETESLNRKEHKIDRLTDETTVQMENELTKSKYYVDVSQGFPLFSIFCGCINVGVHVFFHHSDKGGPSIWRL